LLTLIGQPAPYSGAAYSWNRFIDTITGTQPAGPAAVVDEVRKVIGALGDGVEDDVAVLALGSAR
jgi:hypothetical protein